LSSTQTDRDPYRMKQLRSVASAGFIVFAVNALETNFSYTDFDLGVYNLTSCSSAPACGVAMASYGGVSAYSNGVDQCTGSSCGGYGTYGYQYQCVELAQRWMSEKFGITPIWYDNANMMCDSYPSGVKKTTTPSAGDLYVSLAGSYGHVAVITAVSSSTVTVLEQNSSPTGTNTYNKADAGCFLTAGSSGGGSCSHLGYYCGNDGLGLNASKLYYCSGSGASPVKSESCGFTCVTAPSGYDDYCDNSGSCGSAVTGYYCGGDKVVGDSSTLYLCESSSPDGAQKCSSGKCVVASSGSDDYCS
jgi:hypothetical protein